MKHEKEKNAVMSMNDPMKDIKAWQTKPEEVEAVRP